MLIVLTVFYSLVVAVSALAALFSATVFDAPGSEKKISHWIFFWSMLAVPFFSVTSIVLGWLFQQQPGSLFYFLLPLVPASVASLANRAMYR